MIYRAVFVCYLQQGIAERDARQRAFGEVKGYLGRDNPSGVRLLSAPNVQNGQSANGQSGQVEQKTDGKKGKVRAYLDAHPDLVQLSVNQVLSALKNAGLEAGRTTVAEVLQGRKHEA